MFSLNQKVTLWVLWAALPAIALGACTQPSTIADTDIIRGTAPGLELGDSGAEVSAVCSFLERYGYLQQAADQVPGLAADDEPACNGTFNPWMQHALGLYQRRNHLDESGTVDQPTLALMSQPRCAVPDYQTDHQGPQQGNAYSFLGGRWPRDTAQLSYCFDNFGHLSPEDARTGLRFAFAQWQQASGFAFAEVEPDSENCDVRISWEFENHGDDHPFGGSLAHAFPPKCRGNDCTDLSGDFHLSYNCDWTLKRGDGISSCDLRHVALHELGHVLGLDHSNDQGSVMRPTYSHALRLGEDDFAGMASLYGSDEPASAGSAAALRDPDGESRSADLQSSACQAAPLHASDPLTGLIGLALLFLALRRSPEYAGGKPSRAN